MVMKGCDINYSYILMENIRISGLICSLPGGAVLLAGVQPFLAQPALADGLVKKTIETGNLTTFQKSAQKEAFRVSKIHFPTTFPRGLPFI